MDAFTVNLAASVATPVVMYAWQWMRSRFRSQKSDTVKVEIVRGKQKFVITSTMSEQQVIDIAKSLSVLLAQPQN